MKKRLKIGMIGGGIGGLVGNWHRYAIRLDDKYELVAGWAISKVGLNKIIKERALIKWE